MITYKEDFLLEENSYKNIYACLVKEKDLKDKNFGLRIPLIKIDSKNITKLIEEKYLNLDEGFLTLTKNLEKYLNIKFSSIYKAKYRYLQLFKKNKANIVFLRIISISLTKKQKESIKLFNSFIINNGYIKIDNLKLKINTFTKKITYLAGVIAGDGHLDRRECSLVICDGQSNKKDLLLSKIYLYNISKIFNIEFNITGSIENFENYWVYYVNNKWLCRFFNYYFDIPFGKKSDVIKFPTHLHSRYGKYFWRGIMDTDGYISKYNKQIILKSGSLVLLNQFRDFCNKNNIQTDIRKEIRGWSIRVLTVSILNYAELVGFSHPRKKSILIKYLKEGSKYKVLKSINFTNSPDLFALFKYLRPYKTSVYIKLDEFGRKANREDIENKIKLIKEKFNVRIGEIKRNRHNNHFYINSKKFTDFVRDNAIYGLPWQSLNDNKIKELSKKWIL